jgi:hypothetical protein
MHALFRDALAAAAARVVEIRGNWSERQTRAAVAVANAIDARSGTP